ncbi:hypothetical protein PG993_012029 [Apiospora rasikravindrae]|uniref:Uncharacterized protein n=1 Tax=Apiospora rasikravindrae TaxID=990691 RepID=A0ABR1S1U2_9PEZI
MAAATALGNLGILSTSASVSPAALWGAVANIAQSYPLAFSAAKNYGLSGPYPRGALRSKAVGTMSSYWKERASS